MRRRTAGRGPFDSWELALATVGIAAVLLDRTGLVVGGRLGYDLLLGLAGRRFVLAVGRGVPPRTVLADGIAAAWPGLFAAGALTVGWVLLTPDTAADALVRGEALATIGGYGNWHQLAHAPGGVAASPADGPLRGMWAWSVLVQVAVAWFVAWGAGSALARRRAASGRRRRSTGTVLGTSTAVAAVHLAGAVAVVLLASTDGVLLSTLTRGLAFSAAALATVVLLRHPERFRRLQADGARLACVAVFGALVGVACRSDALTVRAVALLVPIVVAVLVLGVGTAGARRGAAGERAGPRPVAAPGEVVVFSIVWIAGPALAIGRADRLGLPWPLGVLLGLVLAAAASAVTVGIARRRRWDDVALERRRVLGPAAVAVLMIVTFSVTGAFHWDRPMSRERWLCRNDPAAAATASVAC